MSRTAHRIAAATAALAGAVVFASCSGEGANDGPIANVDGADPVASAPKDAVSGEIETLTGAHTRVVWTQQQNPGKHDKHGNGQNWKLLGWDSRDGKGERVILDKVKNYTRPILTPDGRRIVFTDKGVVRKGSKRTGYKPKCFVVNFDGSGLRALRDGYADEVWVDPKNGRFWVYVGEGFPSKGQTALEAKKLTRFPLDDPKTVETVYSGRISMNNLQLSRDGKAMAGLFPWPEARMLDVASGRLRKIGHGCWTSIAPDNSYLSWVFDGAHMNISMAHPNIDDEWVVKINTQKEVRKRDVYHPRWSNHPRILAVTGSYDKKAKSNPVELYLGKFDPGMTKVAKWVRVTDNTLADTFPDVWISGGEQASLEVRSLGDADAREPKGKVAQQIAPKPKNPGPEEAEAEASLVLRWDNAKADNRAGERVARVTARGRARFGRFEQMHLGGGHFELDAETRKALDAAHRDGSATIQFLVTPATPNDGTIYSDGTLSVFASMGRLRAKSPSGTHEAGAFTPGTAAHVAFRGEDGNWTVFRDGQPAATVSNAVAPASKQGIFGDGAWEGHVEAYSVHDAALEEAVIARTADPLLAAAGERKPATRLKIKGKLTAITEPDSAQKIGAYHRALVVYAYEVEEVLEGSFEDPRIPVLHWAYMDKKFLKSMPREIGKSYTLELEPQIDHPELKSEYTTVDGVPISLLASPVWFDITTPQP